MQVRQYFFLIVVLGIVVSFNAVSSRFLHDQFFHERAEGLMIVTPWAGAWADAAGLAADYCVLEADHYWHQGRWYLIPGLYRNIVATQPSYRDYWSLLGWFLAFNTESYLTDEDARRRAIDEGLGYLEKGLRYHAGTYHLYFDAAWINYKKKRNYDEAYRLIVQALAREHPYSVDRLATLIMCRLGRFDEATAVWEAYRARVPQSMIVEKELAKIYEARRKTGGTLR